MTQVDAWRMVRKRAVAAGIMAPIGNHSFRATGITAYLANGGALEHAQSMAAHESPRTTKLYDRTKERLTQDEVERIIRITSGLDSRTSKRCIWLDLPCARSRGVLTVPCGR
jgi:site-specific recombinase XerD